MKYILEIIASLHIGGAEKVARDIGLFLDSQQYKVHYIVFGDSVGEYEEDVVYVRNDKYQIDYEILFDERKYTEAAPKGATTFEDDND